MQEKENSIKRSKETPDSAKAGGYAEGADKIINNLFEEEKFHARQGHGFAAERANTMHDKLHGKNSEVLGDNNVKNGPDRVIHEPEGDLFIQSKYCATGKRCIDACFEKNGSGTFRYFDSNNNPMLVEVPSDKYEEALKVMQNKIRNGQVPGVTNPDDAEKIVKQGNFTYQQAVNIAKAGTIESLKYDAINGAVVSASAFGVSAIIAFAVSTWNHDSFDVAIRKAALTGLKVGGTTFATSVITSQLSKAGLNSALVASSETLIRAVGAKRAAIMINAFRSGKNIYGAAAMKSAAKLLRGNVITMGVTVVLFSTYDVAEILRGRISAGQLVKNFCNTTGTVVGGTGGWIGGAALGSMIAPGIGTLVGGLAGSVGAGAALGKVTDIVVGKFIKDDAEKMIEILEKCLNEIVVEYLLSKDECEYVVGQLQKKLDVKMIKTMFASKDHNIYARNMIVPIVEKKTKEREKVTSPTVEQMGKGITELISEISEDDLAMGGAF